jgi:hypothetical protein
MGGHHQPASFQRPLIERVADWCELNWRIIAVAVVLAGAPVVISINSLMK